MTDYALIIKQIQAFAEVSADCIALMANVSALLYHTLGDVNWAGFYLVKNNALLLGPFQGNIACIKIEKGKGVCGTAWAADAVQVVEDVHTFAGHIACDSASRSEIVLPLHRAGEVEVVAVLDIDSPVPARFSAADVQGLSKAAQTIEQVIEWGAEQ